MGQMHSRSTRAFCLPTGLVESAAQDSSPERRQWVGRLPATVRDLAERWALDVGEPYQPGGRCSWVAQVRATAGQYLVLKVGWRHDEAEHEAAALLVWDGRGAVRVYDAWVSGSTSALLLERCEPGTTLGSAVPEDEQDVVIAGLLQRLWTVPPDGHPFQPLQTMCDAWAAEFQARLAAGPPLLDPGVARAGIELLQRLPASAQRHVLLCTDLHAGNVLAAEREPWLVIDPKPYVGDPAYDVLQHLFNCENRLTMDPIGLTTRMAELLGLDADRVLLWLFARCVQESMDQPWLRHLATRLAPS